MIAKASKTITLRLNPKYLNDVHDYMDIWDIKTMSGAYTNLMSKQRELYERLDSLEAELVNAREMIDVRDQTLEAARLACQKVVEITGQSDLFGS